MNNMKRTINNLTLCATLIASSITNTINGQGFYAIGGAQASQHGGGGAAYLTAPTISKNGTCQSGITLTASNGVAYVWNTGDTTQNITVNNAGIYTVNIKAANGCIKTISISIPTCPTLSGTLSESPACGGFVVSNDTLLLIDQQGIVAPSSVVTDANGSFAFNNAALLGLDSTALYTITTKSGFGINNAGFKTINEWINQSPVALSLSNVNQEWVARYAGPDSLSNFALTVDVNNCVIISGMGQTLTTGYDMITIKYNPNGSQEWVASYDGVQPNTFAYGVGVSSDKQGNVYALGGTSTGWVTIKYNAQGVEQWQALHNGYDPTAIAVDKQGNVYVSGNNAGTTSGNDQSINIIKYSPNGTELWQKQYGINNGGSYAVSMAIDSNANVYIGGYNTLRTNLQSEYITLKYDTDGQELWQQTYNNGNANGLTLRCIGLDDSSNVYVTGTEVMAGQSNITTTTIKYNSNGAEQWRQTELGYIIYNKNIPTDKAGNSYVAAMLNNGLNLLKYNTDGILQWTLTYPDVYPMGIDIDANGDVYVSMASVITYNFITIKCNQNGTIEWEQIGDGSGTKNKQYINIPRAMGVSNSGNVYIVGHSTFIPTTEIQTYSEYTTIKYSQCLATAPLLKWDGKAEPVIPSAKMKGDIGKIKVYPNPSNGSLQVDYSLEEGQQAELLIFDMLGNKRNNYKLKAGNKTLSINDTELQNGIYYYQVISNTQILKQDKIIIIK